MVAPVRRSNKVAAILGRLRQQQQRPFISRAVRRRSNKSKQKNASSVFSRYASTALIVIVLQCLLISLFVYNPNWIQDFLNGPRIAYKPSPILKEYNHIPNDNNNEDNTQQQNYNRRPEDPIPIRDHIFTALTRKERKQIKHQKKKYEELKESNKLIPCQLDNGDCEHQININNPTKSSSWQNIFSFRGSSSSLSSSKVSLLIYNPLPESRYFCGNKIQGGGGTIELTEFPPSSSCSTSQYSYLYSPHPPHPPPLNGKKGIMKKKDQQPIELYWNAMDDPSFYYDSNEELAAVTTKKFKNCPILCRTNGEFNILSTINIRDTKWEITMTMEGEDYYGEAHYKKKNYVNDRYYATTSFKSEIPVPYFSWAEYKINHTPPVNFDKAIKGASFLANNCDSMNKREDLVQGLLKTKLRVDSLSSCFHNAEVPVGVNIENKTQVLEQYLFHLAFENQRTNDYITEKLWGTLAAGTIPVYFGAPNIKDHVPPNSVIFVDDYQTTQELADYLIKLTKDKSLYESYHKWRFEDMDTNFMDKYRFTDTHSTCRICKWAYAKKHGLEWNHSAQEIQEPYIAHKTCRNKNGFISWPFKEFWLSPPSAAAADGGGKSRIKVITGEDDVGIKTCDLDDNNRLIRIGTGGEEGGILFQRRVYDQDGVTDLVIGEVVTDSQHQQQVEKEYILKLETPIMSNELIEKQRGKEYWLQDSQSRMTLLSNRNVTVTTTTTAGQQQQQQGGTTTASVQIVITRSIRIRVIMENIDTFHKKATTRENYFGELMKQDFFNPLQAYRVVQT